jgi:hypothetical protein
MRRSLINKIRFILEELLPPILRDSAIFKYIVKYFYRKDHLHENLKSRTILIFFENF